MFPYLRISKIRFITRFALNYHARDYEATHRSGTSRTQVMQQTDGAEAMRDKQSVAIGRADRLCKCRLPSGEIGMLTVG